MWRHKDYNNCEIHTLFTVLISTVSSAVCVCVCVYVADIVRLNDFCIFVDLVVGPGSKWIWLSYLFRLYFKYGFSFDLLQTEEKRVRDEETKNKKIVFLYPFGLVFIVIAKYKMVL